jgi:hypothetical protein
VHNKYNLGLPSPLTDNLFLGRLLLSPVYQYLRLCHINNIAQPSMHATQGFNPEISASAKTAFETAVHQVTIQTDSCMKARVCFCCDCFLENGEDKTIPIKTLRKEKMKLLFKGNPGIPERLHKYYTVPNCPALKELILSPRATLIQHTSNTDGGYLCCNECYSFLHCGRLPTFAIANHKTIGEAPKCLASLNPVELALISKARTDKHIFQYYGGAHQTIKGWHTFYASDLNQLSAVMNTLESSSDKVSIATLLIGPFTTEQRKKVREQSEVRVSFVRKALKLLSKHNIHYNDVDYMAQLADSVICIDSAGPDCPSICS